MSAQHPGAGQVITYQPDGTQPRYLGAIGHVTALTYSSTLPGGPEQLQCTLQAPATLRTDALRRGRIVRVIRGTSVAWDGKLDEPAPGPDGWTITAHGAGTLGDDFDAIYTGTWGTSTPDNAVNAAIARGLRWKNPGIGNPSGMWLGDPQDTGSLKITDLLNLITSMGGLTWLVDCRPAGQNTLTVFPLPTAANRLLVANTPVPLTAAGDVDAVDLRYEITADGDNPATYGLTTVTDQATISQFGRVETYADLEGAGVMTLAAAQGVGAQVLKRYQRLTFTGPFTVAPGQLLNLGGQPVDLGAEQAGTVCKLLLTDYAGDGVTPGPATILVGRYEYDDDTQSAQITPFQSLADSFDSLMTAATTAITPISPAS